MIYSEDINKVCGLCVNADILPDDEDTVFCRMKGVNTDCSTPDCGKFKYDIFKKKVHRKRRLSQKFTAADFMIE